ncbi:hypothetical protein [Rhizorhabdus argentea]|uniref:hypothetical protein n=1 Tax=Rhizorhabdus argentea TaxID=1387174 RepID=UPI0030EF2D23
MFRKSLLILGFAGSAALFTSTSAFAEGKTDLARKAIAAAQAKIDAIHIVGAAGDAPRLHGEALAALHLAEDELRHHAKEAAMHDATHASELADMALAASERERAEAQQAATAEAQRQAEEANSRAAAAQADAAAARSAPPVVVQTPAPASPPTSTTVTTQTDQVETPAAPRVVVHRAVHHQATHRRPAGQSTHTSTTVTTVTH